MIKKWILALNTLCFVSLGSLASASECASDRAGDVSFDYCIDDTDMARNSDVIVYFHGANGSAREWQDREAFRAVERAWSETRGPRPAVISISFGSFWLLKDFAGNSPEYMKILIEQALPRLYAKLPFRGDEKVLMGASMGGFNAIQVFARNPGMFARAAFLCPAFSTVNPFSTAQEVDAFIDRHRDYINEFYVRFLIDYVADSFPTLTDYQRHDPLLLVDRFSRATKPVFIACGERDEFGFIEGSTLFANKAMAKGAPITWLSIPGAGHCSNVEEHAPALASFLKGS